MSLPRHPGRDLSLERLEDRDGLRPAPLGDAAHVGAPLGQTASLSEFLAAYQSLIDAVFTAPGAVEWLLGLRLAMTKRFLDRDAAPRLPEATDAIRPAEAGLRRS